jgi:hypothetical protein
MLNFFLTVLIPPFHSASSGSTMLKEVPELLCNSKFYQHSFTGTYTGYFGNSPIEITLESVLENGSVSGFSLHKGIKRPLDGTWEKVEGPKNIRFILNEPGDHKYDGHFVLIFDADTFEGKGAWYPKPGGEMGEVPVNLKKKT